MICEEQSMCMRVAIPVLLAAGFFSAACPGQQAELQERPQAPRVVGEVAVDEVIAGRQVALVLVKDFMRFQSAASHPAVEFERYMPVIDEQQVVLGRWVTAVDDEGHGHPVSVVSSTEDSAGNLIQKYRVGAVTSDSPVLVATTTLVARRERKPPQGRYPIARAGDYPPEVREYLRASEMIVLDHELVRAEAETLLKRSGGDVLKIVTLMAERARARQYLPKQGLAEMGTMPLSAFVLKYGGSCCSSAVSAVAVLRTLGIPAQVTYCPAAFVHGITRLYLNGYGWIRMDTTSGNGRYPLVQEVRDLGYLRLYDLPMEMEYAQANFAWPYQHQNLHGRKSHLFSLDGHALEGVKQVQADAPEGALPYVMEPFRHLEPGSWNKVLGGVPVAGAWTEWNRLVARSRAAVKERCLGVFAQMAAELDVDDYVREAQRSVYGERRVSTIRSGSSLALKPKAFSRLSIHPLTLSPSTVPVTRSAPMSCAAAASMTMGLGA